MRARALPPALVLLSFAAFASPAVALPDDTTPPEGTFRINAGAEWTNDPVLDLDVTATDDVGVVQVRIRPGGKDWIDYPYEPHITYSLGAAGTVADGTYQFEVEWADAAGNRSGAFDLIQYDGTAPNFPAFKQTTPTIGPENTVTFYVGLNDSPGYGQQVRFSSNGGSTWGAAVPLNDTLVAWDPFDVAHGGSKTIGTRTVSAQVSDPAGNWSNVRSTQILALATATLRVSANRTTGQAITLTPVWTGPSGPMSSVGFGAGTHCMWEFITGDDHVLSGAGHNETYAYFMTQGPKSGDWCGPWTFTLPWSPVRQYQVHFRVIFDGGMGIDAELGSPDQAALTAAVGSTSRAVKSSNLPLIYVLPDDAPLTVGVPTTYRAFAVGGAEIRSTDRWMVVPDTTFYPGSSSFTFTPTRAGHITVCYARRPGSTPMDQLGACFDPTVRRGTSATAAPSVSAAPSGAAPTELPINTGLPTTGPTTTPGAVAVATGAPSRTDRPDAAPNEGPISGAADSEVPWALAVFTLAALVGGAALLARPGVRARLRSRTNR